MTFRNEECSISSDIFWNTENVTVRCYAGSSAEAFAQQAGIPYELIPKPFRLPAELDRIEEEAFLGVNAEQIQVPGGVVWIGPDAFSPETVLVVNPGSYAEDWARDNGQPYIY